MDTQAQSSSESIKSVFFLLHYRFVISIESSGQKASGKKFSRLDQCIKIGDGLLRVRYNAIDDVFPSVLRHLSCHMLGTEQDGLLLLQN